jgi:hypothetical protein
LPVLNFLAYTSLCDDKAREEANSFGIDLSDSFERMSYVASTATELTFTMRAGALCTGYLGYPFQYLCDDDELHPYLFLFIYLMGKLFHSALYPRILERISQVASKGLRGWSNYPLYPMAAPRAIKSE